MTGEREDPILAAGAVRCARCGVHAYPADAAWLDDQLVLATFTQPHRAECQGARTWTLILDTCAGPGQVFSHAPRDNGRLARDYYRQHSCRACGVLTGARYCAACRCQAQTAQGRRCANRASQTGTCQVHADRTAHV